MQSSARFKSLFGKNHIKILKISFKMVLVGAVPLSDLLSLKMTELVIKIFLSFEL